MLISFGIFTVNFTYFPAHKKHFSLKMWSKFDLRLMHREYVLLPNLQTTIPASSEKNHEDDFSGSDDDFLGFCDE